MPLLPPTLTKLPLSAAPESDHVDGKGDMFDAALIEGLIPTDVPEGLRVRPLNLADYDCGFLTLLSQLTSVGEVTRECFTTRFVTMRDTVPKQYFVVVIEELSTNTVIAAATLVLELKFIHGAGARGRVEDVVVSQHMRGKRLGHVLNTTLVGLAKKMEVYKLSLECKDALIPFYAHFGYKIDEGNNFLVQRFDGPKEAVIEPSHL